jgi:hypothetical protein
MIAASSQKKEQQCRVDKQQNSAQSVCRTGKKQLHPPSDHITQSSTLILYASWHHHGQAVFPLLCPNVLK